MIQTYMHTPSRFALLLLSAALLAAAGCADTSEPVNRIPMEDPCVTLRAERAEFIRYLQTQTQDPMEAQRVRENIQRLDAQIRDCEARSGRRAPAN